jgi:hypothetical protein
VCMCVHVCMLLGFIDPFCLLSFCAVCCWLVCSNDRSDRSCHSPPRPTNVESVALPGCSPQAIKGPRLRSGRSGQSTRHPSVKRPTSVSNKCDVPHNPAPAGTMRLLSALLLLQPLWGALALARVEITIQSITNTRGTNYQGANMTGLGCVLSIWAQHPPPLVIDGSHKVRVVLLWILALLL